MVVGGSNLVCHCHKAAKSVFANIPRYQPLRGTRGTRGEGIERACDPQIKLFSFQLAVGSLRLEWVIEWSEIEEMPKSPISHQLASTCYCLYKYMVLYFSSQNNSFSTLLYFVDHSVSRKTLNFNLLVRNYFPAIKPRLLGPAIKLILEKKSVRNKKKKKTAKR